MLEPKGKTEYSGLARQMFGGAYYVKVVDLLDVVANRAILGARELAVPGQSTTHYDLLRGMIQELQQIETQLHE